MLFICFLYAFYMLFICFLYAFYMLFICFLYAFYICCFHALYMLCICFSYAFHMLFICFSYAFYTLYIWYTDDCTLTKCLFIQRYFRLPDDSRVHFENELLSKIESMYVRGQLDFISDDVNLTLVEETILLSKIEPRHSSILQCGWLKVQGLLRELADFAQGNPVHVQRIIYETMQPCNNLVQLYASSPADTVAAYKTYLAANTQQGFDCVEDALNWIAADPTRKLAFMGRSKIVASIMCDIDEFMTLVEPLSSK
jgi:hypothetical protein